MKIIFYLVILLFSLGQLGRLSFFGQTINLYLYEIVVGFIFLYLLLKFRLTPIKHGLKHFKIIFWFIGILLISYLLNFFRFSLFQNFVAFLYLIRLVIYLGFWGYWGYWLNKEKINFSRHFWNMLVIFTFLTIISSYLQYFLYPDLRNLFYLGWDPHLYRMFGVFFDTSVAAAIYGVLFLFFYKSERVDKTFKLIFILTFLICLVLTFSRGAYLALLFVIIWDLLSHKKITLIFAFLAVFLLMTFLVPKPFGEGVNLKRVFSIAARFEDYKQAINIWKNSPLFGIGYNRIRYVKPTLSESHAAASFASSYLIILVAGGIFGLLGFLGVLRRLWFIDKKLRIILLFLVILSLFDNILLHPFIMFFLGWFIVGKWR